MDLWDKLCHLLRVRGISVEDVSNKVRTDGRTVYDSNSSRTRVYVLTRCTISQALGHVP